MTLSKKPLYYPVAIIFVVVAGAIFYLGYATLQNRHREEQLMIQHLTSLGTALMKSVESSMGVGMMHMSWQRRELQTLFEDIARQPNIHYLLLVDENGRIRVSSGAQDVGGTLSGPPVPFDELLADRVTAQPVRRYGNRESFELQKLFAFNRSRSHMSMMHNWMPHMNRMLGVSDTRLAFVLGLSMEEYHAARQEDLRRALTNGAILVILALASTFFALVIQKYYATNQALRDAESFTRHVIESMGQGLIALDAGERIVTINKKACALLNLDETAVQGRPFLQVMEPLDCSVDTKEILAREWKEHRMRCTLADGRSLSLSLTTSHILDEQNELLGKVIVLRDLQELEALEEKVKRSERLAGLGQMAAGIAHEVRNPLGSIKGLAQYFARKFQDEPEVKKYAEAIIGETDRLNRIIRDLLDFARPQQPQYRTCSLTDIIDHALALVQSDLQAKHVQVQRRGDDAVPPLQADPDLLSQALMNMFLNAIEAMQPHGRLSITSRFVESEQTITIQIADTGHGIAAKDLPKIFDPFFTLKKGGTGLGLALVHRIIENHGGSIDVHSQVGKGTTFTILLPKKP